MGYARYTVILNGETIDAGYDVPDICHQDGCSTVIDRGLDFLCGERPGDNEPGHGCGRYFCNAHLYEEPEGQQGQRCWSCLPPCCSYQIAVGSYETPPEHCEEFAAPGSEYCEKHDKQLAALEHVAQVRMLERVAQRVAAASGCPRCAGPLAQFDGDRGAASRVMTERDCRICGACGMDEAVRDAMGLPPIPPGEWPTTRRPLTWEDTRA